MDELPDARLLLTCDRRERIEIVAGAASLHGLQRVREAASGAAASSEPLLQAAGALALGALGIDDAESRDRLSLAAGRLVGSADPGVREAVAEALGMCSTDGRMTLPLLLLADDSDPTVRLAAVQGLSVPADDEPEDGGVVAVVLLRRFADPEPDVRDFAVFALGVNRDVDGPALRDALFERLDDNGAGTSGEAAVALARRGDRRVLPALTRHLAHEDVGNLWVEAAAELGEPTLLPALLSLRDAGWAQDDARPQVLEDAIRACRRMGLHGMAAEESDTPERLEDGRRDG
ncbi:MAG: HEAT repeat domain-containing protein [Dehalococcoidia bacterium]